MFAKSSVREKKALTMWLERRGQLACSYTIISIFCMFFFCASLDPLDLLHLKLSSQRVWMKKGGDFDHPFPLNNNSWQLLSDFQILFFKKRFDLLGIFFHLASLCPRYLLLHVDFLSRGKTTFWHWDNMTFWKSPRSTFFLLNPPTYKSFIWTWGYTCFLLKDLDHDVLSACLKLKFMSELRDLSMRSKICLTRVIIAF